ncbi:MAG: carboxypeptidase-like regulatory domain-containing protein, partial [Acidobacteriota bacterium]|nr:carboxypeptidase-like regulatory domain-containing protein [Acidobacteriota bacterium]
ELFPAAAQNFLATNADDLADAESGIWNQTGVDISKLEAGQLGGIVADVNGAIIPNAVVTVTNTQSNTSVTTRSDGDGKWVVSGVQPGPVMVMVESAGFKRAQQELQVSGSRSAPLGFTLDVGNISETVTVQSNTSNLMTLSPGVLDQVRKNQAAQATAPSQNVFNLQRRVAGILPVRVEIPRSGRSYRFVRPLVLDEETNITFQYKAR